MNIEVSLTGATLRDVIQVIQEGYDEWCEVTLGEAVTDALMEALKESDQFPGLAARFAEMAGRHLRAQGPEYVQRLVADEVERQLSSAKQGAITRGEPSTMAQAIVATEVTTQLRAAFAPVVERHLAALETELDGLAAEVTTSVRATIARFREGMPGG